MKLDNIAIVGGGIGGLASSILFASMGCKVTVYEQAAEAGPVGAGFLLQPPGQRVLHELGVLQEVMKHAIPITRLRSETISGYTILDLDYRDLGVEGRHGLGIQRKTIYNALYNKALESDLIDFKWNSAVASINTGDKGVSIVANEQQDSFDFCILSSGSNSRLASGHFSKHIKNTYAWGCIWTSIRLSQSLSPDTLHQRCHRSNKMMGILPVRKVGESHEAALYWSIKTSDMQHKSNSDYQQLKNEILDFWPEAESSILPLEPTDFISAVYRDIWTPKPYSGRLIAIGDAAHGTSPQLGQGCTMALLDAWLLAKYVGESEKSLEERLEKWWSTRKYQLLYVRYLSRFLTPLYQSDNDFFAFLRDFIIAPTGRIPWFYKLQLKTLASEVFLKY